MNHAHPVMCNGGWQRAKGKGNCVIGFQINNFIPLSAGPEGEIRVRRTCGYVVEDFD